VQKPVVCNLARDYNLTFNILNASISPRKEGMMVLQLSGTPQNFKKGVQYLKDEGIVVVKAGAETRRNEERCTHCGACTAVCPTGALSIRRLDMHVVFDPEKCSVCKMCLSACPPHAMMLRPSPNSVFK